ncbi:MAG: hypothetical protein IT429_26095 [Gemmataceae bacterium]|nr:hypothetical protein [Gemmataceae bacterium]
MALQTRTRTHIDSMARWLKAAERAVTEGIQIRQLQGSGQWVATSGHDATVAYEVQVAGNVAFGCDCLAGLNGDPVCKHRAAYYLLVGALSLDPEPEPPAPAVAQDCPACHGCGVVYDPALEQAGWLYPACPACHGRGTATPPPSAHTARNTRLAA